MIYAGGPKFSIAAGDPVRARDMLFFSCFLARRERKEAVFRPVEAALFAALGITASAGIYALAVGAISI